MALMPRRVLVTGCSSPRGIGFATARELARRGHQVVATVRRHDHDGQLRSGRPTGLHVASMDLLDECSVRAALAEADAVVGGIDVLVNNAGFGLIGGIEQATLQQARAQFDTNYFGTIGLVREVLPRMRAQRQGHVLSVSTIFVPTLCPMAIGHYIASKAALETALQALAQEVAPWGIRVTSVQPGPVDTGLSRQWARPADDPRPGLTGELYAWIGAQNGLRMETPGSVGAAIADIIGDGDPPPAAQTSAAGTAWVARALRDPSRRSERSS
jgi:NAD(P)-dependent dehydrogenase (short-subunit alcohol dehydrogenase family)